MTTKELATKLNGRQYGEEITKEEEQEAAENRLVVVFWYSDDNMEFRGAIDDEVGCYGGGVALVTTAGLLEDCESNCPHYQAAERKAIPITASFDTGGYSWTFEVDGIKGVEHFDILEGDDKYCRGIVFSLDAVPA